MTYQLAFKKIAITAGQAFTAFILLVLGAQIAGSLTVAWAVNTFLVTFAVPTVTAIQRLFQASTSPT